MKAKKPATGARVRRGARGERDSGPSAATARVVSLAGRWVALHGSLLETGSEWLISVVVEALQAPSRAGLVLQASGLSDREQEVVRLVVHGASTGEIAQQLFLSSYTVQDHLKSVFSKTGVHSRRELVALLAGTPADYGCRRPEASPGTQQGVVNV